MSSVAEERVARSVALEKAYVHDVYEQFSDGPRGRPWPKVNQFLADLEPGSLVCDVGCGNGKYLGSNPSVFNIGADKCIRLTKVAREKENEVLVCDNLALPFRDESFDAVLSVAVVHHFATTERRVCALRELARILRIGGRLIISVWAMEQTHRKFESQDVLVPWHRPQTLSTPSLELTSTTNTSEEDVLPPYHAYTQTSDSDSNKSIRTKGGLRKKGRTRHKGRSIDPGRSSSPSSSSLSSPNETCYSFVRRAIQKLAGGKRSGSSHRPWFLDTWNSCTKEPMHKRYDPDGCENYDCGNVQDLPIELRRVDDDELPQRRQTFPSSQIQLGSDLYGVKSKSLTDIKTFQDRLIVRSQSSDPSLQQDNSQEDDFEQEELDTIPMLSTTTVTTEVKTTTTTIMTTTTRTKPKLVKQKQSICDEDAEEALDKPTDMRNLVNALPDFRVYHGNNRHRGSVFKQRSMNEELMSTERLREKERVKRNIQKQASLNEDLIYQRHTLDSLRDSFFSVSTSKRFQLIKSGFTNTIKNSTTNIEKVAGSSLKNGFVRMFQGWKATELVVSPTQPQPQTQCNNTSDLNDDTTNSAQVKPIVVNSSEEKKDATTPGERRHSREDGSDSSKDSSLQSDTSVDSEDSFASVIFIPKTDPLSPTPLSPGPTSPRLKQTSVPNSPRMKQSSCPTSPRIKQMPLTVYPLTKQLSSPKPSTSTTATPVSVKQTISTSTKQSPGVIDTTTTATATATATATTTTTTSTTTSTITKLSCARDQIDTEDTTPTVIEQKPKESTSPAIINKCKKAETLAQKYSVVMIPKFKKTPESDIDSRLEDKKRSERLKQIRELLKERPGFGIRSSRSAFPIVRQTSVRSGGRLEAIAKPLPRLLSLELFNPETDDKDSDSSGVSSPDSVDSVINIEISENGTKSETSSEGRKTSPTLFAFPPVTVDTTPIKEQSIIEEPETIVQAPEITINEEETEATSMSLLEAAAEVANSLDEAVDTVIQSSPRAKRRQIPAVETNEVKSVMERQYDTECDARSPIDSHIIESTWDEECHKHLTDFADKLSEKLLLEIDQYQEQSRKLEQKEVKFNVTSSFQHIDDPYIHRLSEELKDLNKLSAEIQKQNQYLSQLKIDLTGNNLNLSKLDGVICTKCKIKQCKCSERIHLDSDLLKSDKVPYFLKSNNSNSNSNSNIAEIKSVQDQGCLGINKLVSLTEMPEEQPHESGSSTLNIRNSTSRNSHRLSRESSDASADTNSLKGPLLLGPQHSIESNDTADISERTTTSGGSDSQKDTNSISRYSDGGSTASLASCTEWKRNPSSAKVCRSLSGCRSASHDKQSDDSLNEQMLTGNFGSLNASLSDTSQDSLPSDNIGGAITYHRYYHVFREGELDQLIERYVENLHIISSYYDHASWCVVAEKVQVWTI